jgi:hypothetical protein
VVPQRRVRTREPFVSLKGAVDVKRAWRLECRPFVVGSGG